MVKWLERWAADPKVPGSNPALPAFFFAYRLLALFYIFFQTLHKVHVILFLIVINEIENQLKLLLFVINLLSANSLICMTQDVLQIWLVSSITWPYIAKHMYKIQWRPTFAKVPGSNPAAACLFRVFPIFISALSKIKTRGIRLLPAREFPCFYF